MNKNVLIAFGGAIIIAILVAVMMSAMLKGGKKEKEVAAQEVPRVEILVAAEAMGIGHTLTNQNVKWKSWPQDAVYPGTIVRTEKQKLSEVAKGRTLRAFVAEEPLLESALVEEDGNFLAARLDPGMRAVAIKTSANAMAGGLINPGDYVDVVLTYSIRFRASSEDRVLEEEMQRVILENIERYASETIMRNVKVLGIDQRTTVDEKGAAKVGKTITLEVNERGAEVLALASKMGDITLILRPLGDTNVDDDGQKTVSDARLITINDELVKALTEVEQSSGANRRSVRIYSGGSVMNLPTR